MLMAELMFTQIPYVILEQCVQIGKKLQVVRKKEVIWCYFKLFFYFLCSSVVLSSEEDDDLQYVDHDYEVPQQKGLKKICNKVKWTRDEVILFFGFSFIPI